MLPPGRLEADTTFLLLEIKAFSFLTAVNFYSDIHPSPSKNLRQNHPSPSKNLDKTKQKMTPSLGIK
jgi:hypothetical protein